MWDIVLFNKFDIMTTEQQQALISATTNKELDVAKIMAILTEEGYIPNKNKEQKLQWAVMLLGAFKNITIFSDDKQRQFINFLIKLNRL